MKVKFLELDKNFFMFFPEMFCQKVAKLELFTSQNILASHLFFSKLITQSMFLELSYATHFFIPREFCFILWINKVQLTESKDRHVLADCMSPIGNFHGNP